MKAFLRCIAIATEQEKDKIWVQAAVFAANFMNSRRVLV